MLQPTTLVLSGERFTVVYRLTGSAEDARAKAEAICIEQTIEFPAALIPDDDIRGQVFGRIVDFKTESATVHTATISYAVEVSGGTLLQLLNVIFGNSSIKPGIRVERFDLPDTMLTTFKGPRFGQQGWRELLGVGERPLLCTALKPMGFSAEKLADFAYQFALGGIDIIKDDHGLADQPFAPFRKRVALCAAAVARANAETGFNCQYMPSVNASAEKFSEYAHFAKENGAGSLLVMPGLSGFGAMRQLADDDQLNLPIMSHPALLGSFVTSPDNGFSHFALFGQLMRLAGADAVVFPNYGGRFAFSREQCGDIARGSAETMSNLKPSFPAPGGGMTLDRIPDMANLYGQAVIYLVGGGLHQGGTNLVENSRQFRQLIEK